METGCDRGQTISATTRDAFSRYVVCGLSPDHRPPGIRVGRRSTRSGLTDEAIRITTSGMKKYRRVGQLNARDVFHDAGNHARQIPRAATSTQAAVDDRRPNRFGVEEFRQRLLSAPARNVAEETSPGNDINRPDGVTTSLARRPSKRSRRARRPLWSTGSDSLIQSIRGERVILNANQFTRVRVGACIAATIANFNSAV